MLQECKIPLSAPQQKVCCMQKELMLFFSFHASTGPRCGLFGQDSPPLAADGAAFSDVALEMRTEMVLES